MDDFINFPLLGKLLVVAILIPAWLPVVRELWKEINASLIEEGGVFGELPTKQEADELLRKRQSSGESLISVPRDGRSSRLASKRSGAVQMGRQDRGF